MIFRSATAQSKTFHSHGEEKIARALEEHGIPYSYEHPLAVVDDGKVRIWYPDFQLPEYGILIEYFGMLNDRNYLAGMSKKEAVYEANGLAAVLLTPDLLDEDWPASMLDRIEGILCERLTGFHDARARFLGPTR